MNLTVADLYRRLADDPRPALRFEDRSWSWQEHVRLSAARAAFLQAERHDGPFHIGLLLDNAPEYPLLLGAAAMAGAVVVGLNPTRSPADLERDVAHTDCQFVITDAGYLALVEGVDVPLWDVESRGYLQVVQTHAPAPIPTVGPSPEDLFVLIFTSGTTSDPKAVRNSHDKVVASSIAAAKMVELGPDDVTYCAMPLFHSNALLTAWGPSLAVGATLALRRRFSASGFMADVRRFGATYANYVGKPLSYVLAEPERPGDDVNPLRRVFGNEASPRDVVRFAQRFGCRVTDAYGSSEGGIAVFRTEETPPGSLGQPVGDVRVLDPDTGEECAVADLDGQGLLRNPQEAIGELVRVDSVGRFEGYWRNEEADAERVHDGRFHSGDLGYRDADGHLYFAGRLGTWLRVDGENLAVAPIEQALGEHPDIVDVAVYGVPDDVGDAVVAAIVLREGTSFDPDHFAYWVDSRRDLGRKARPTYIRILSRMPHTATNKTVTRGLAEQGLDVRDPVWMRERGAPTYTPYAPE
ncbi:MAG: AMP-binding protein [Actinobacteria bacterium]|nr:AMP-binding protein [Actinomycetota bacterium]